MYTEQDVTEFIDWMYRLDELFIKQVGQSVHSFKDMPFKQWFDCGLTVQDVVDEFILARLSIN